MDNEESSTLGTRTARRSGTIGSSLDPALNRPIPRPDRSLPPGYIPPASALPKGYRPPRPDLQRSSELARPASRPWISRRQFVLLALALGIFIALVAGGAAYAFTTNNASLAPSGNPRTTVTSFYTALSHQDYTHAYDLLAPVAQQAESRDAFIQRYLQLDQVGGGIATYTLGDSQQQGSSATISVLVTRHGSSGHPTVDIVQLTQTNRQWSIVSIATHTQTATQP